MSKPSRLEPLVDYADLRENEAARRLATSARNVKAKADELEKLRLPRRISSIRRAALAGRMRARFSRSSATPSRFTRTSSARPSSGIGSRPTAGATRICAKTRAILHPQR